MTSESVQSAPSSSTPIEQAKKHVVITIEPLLDDKMNTSKSGKQLFSNSPTSLLPPPVGPSAELQRQQRRRLLIHLLGWILMAVMVIFAGFLVYFFIF